MRIINTVEHKQALMLYDEIISHFRGERLIPIIGSGFTRESVSKNGKVPSGHDMKNYMSNKLIGISR